jgi:hypothetical protein
MTGQDIPQGIYPFSLYAWEYKGYRPHTEFLLVCESKAIAEELLNALPNMTLSDTSTERYEGVLESQEVQHLSLWKEAREVFLAEVRSNINYKMSSLEKNVAARREQAELQLTKTDDAKIEIMRRREIERLESDLEVKKARYLRTAESADLIATLLASGVIVAEKGDGYK